MAFPVRFQYSWVVIVFFIYFAMVFGVKYCYLILLDR